MSESLRETAALALELALDCGAEDALVGVDAERNTSYTFRDGKIEEVQQSASRSLGLKLYVDGRYSTHNTTDLRAEMLRTFVAEAIALTRHLEPDPHRLIPDPTLYADRSEADLNMVDEKIPTLERDTCFEWMTAMDETNHGDQRVISATCAVHSGERTATKLSSNGFAGDYQNTSITYGSTVALDGGDVRRPEALHWVSGRHLEDLPDPVSVARESLERATRRLDSHKAPSARTAMVVDNQAAGSLLGRLENALSASAVQQNRSFLAGKEGQQIASPLLTLGDEPLLRRGLGSRHFDGEGISARPLPIIEQGVLRNFYVDTYYGRKLGWQPTTGGSSNWVFALGDKGRDELMRDVDTGFYVDGWLGGNADSTSGDFSFGFRGHRIEGGRLGAPVSEMNITGNYLDLLQNLVAVGDDPYPYSSCRTPTLVFTDVEFSGE